MRTLTTLTTCFALALALVACNGDDSSTGDTATSTATMTTTMTTTTSTETTTGTTDDPTTTTTATTTTTTTTMTTEPETTTTTGEDPFMFDATDPETLSQVDRMGMPAINTAVITSKDMYNQSTPADDAMATFVPEIAANVTGLHDALDDDLMGAGLVPCAPADCLDFAGPLVIPDTLKLNLGAAAGFPNGRKLEDPVIDVTLAVVLLDLVNTPGQTPATLAGLPLNPPANDKAFLGDFPYAAEPH